MKLSKWGKDVKIALIERNMTIKELSVAVGTNYSIVSNVIHGKYPNETYKDIAEKINNVLGTKGLPERNYNTDKKWCKAVKIALIEKGLSVNAIASQLGVSRDTVSLVVNGRKRDDEIIDAINRELGITIPAIPCDE